MAAALLLVATVLYWNLSFQAALNSSLQALQNRLALDRAIDASHDKLALAFWEAFDTPSAETKQTYEVNARESNELLRRYDAIPTAREEDDAVARLDLLHDRLLTITTRSLKSAAMSARERQELGRTVNDIGGTLRQLQDLQIRQLELLNTRIAESSRWLALLLLSFGALSLGATVWFRRAHQRHLWNHLEELRLLVGEVRQGNLNITAKIPASVELGALIGTFLEMARELKESRELLEQKVVERTAKLETTQSELLQAAKLASLGELVSGVAHEINNPLTSILGFSEIVLSRAKTDASLRGPIGTIREEALRLRNLVANLTSFARRAPHRTHLMDLRIVLDRLADLRSYQLQANNVALEIQRPGKPLWVIGDADQLLQVALNLVANSEQAIKDCRERGRIELACGGDNERAWLTVKDNGAGMTEEAREHAFDPFFTTKPAGHGTGLGLSISHGIIQQHSGAITMTSEPGAGTLMKITLPLAPKAPADRALPVSDTVAPARPVLGFRALVIDDEQDILEMVEQALEALKCRTTLLHGSGNVEAELEKGEFDLVLCDLKMPGQNGLEVYRLLRAKKPQLADRFLLMTGNLADAEKHAEELASVPILAKPFTLGRLRQAVLQLLPKHPPA